MVLKLLLTDQSPSLSGRKTISGDHGKQAMGQRFN
jgi:hypothetical protein